MKTFKLTILLLIITQSVISQTLVWSDITPKDYYINNNEYIKLGTPYLNISRDIFDGRILLASVDGKLAESIDTGKTWHISHYFVEFDKNAGIHKQTPPESFELNQLEFAENKTYGIYTGVYVYEHEDQTKERTQIIRYTTDGGKTWQMPQTDFTNKECIHVSWKTNDSVFAVVKDHSAQETYMYVSADAGMQWTKTSTNLLTQSHTSVPTYFVVFINNTRGYALGWQGYNVTTDGGKTWSARITNYDLKPQGIMRFSNGQVLISGDKNLDLGIQGCRYRRLDPGNASFNWDPYFIKDMGNGKVYANNNEGLIMSVDSGYSWNWLESKAVYNYFIINQNTHVGINGDNTAISTDGGITWSTYYEKGIAKIKQIYAKTEDEYFMFGNTSEYSRIFRTTDRGNTWNYTDVTYAWGNQNVLVKMLFASPDTAYISARATIHRSIDGGTTWHKFYMPSNGGYIQFLTPQIGFSGPTMWGGLQKTYNGGETWEDASGSMNLDDPYSDYEGAGGGAFRTKDIGLITAKAGLLYTENAGNSWVYKNVGFTGAIKCLGNNWVITNFKQGKMHLCDTNLNFTTTYVVQNYSQYDGLKEMIVIDEKNAIVPLTNTNLLYSKDSALITTDGGLSWEKKHFPYPYAYDNIMALNKYTFYASARGNIYKGVYKIATTSSSFTLGTNSSVECVVANEAHESFTAKILLVPSSGPTIVLHESYTIESNKAFSIAIPQGYTSFTIVIQPTYSDVFETLTSQPFTITNTIEPVNAQDVRIVVQNNTIHCNCSNYRIINSLGQEVPKHKTLAVGVYFVECNNTIYKVHVQ